MGATKALPGKFRKAVNYMVPLDHLDSRICHIHLSSSNTDSSSYRFFPVGYAA